MQGCLVDVQRGARDIFQNSNRLVEQTLAGSVIVEVLVGGRTGPAVAPIKGVIGADVPEATPWRIEERVTS